MHAPGALPPVVPASIEERLADLDEALPGLELIVLFGSAVRGRATARSDIDVGVLCMGLADLDAVYRVLAPRFGSHRLDLVDLRRAGPTLLFAVARTGRVVFERRAGLFRELQSLASRRYADTAKLRAAQRRAIQVFLAKRGLA